MPPVDNIVYKENKDTVENWLRSSKKNLQRKILQIIIKAKGRSWNIRKNRKGIKTKEHLKQFIYAWRSVNPVFIHNEINMQLNAHFTHLLPSHRLCSRKAERYFTTNKTCIPRTQYGELEKQISRCCDPREHVVAWICLSELWQIRRHNSNREYKRKWY